MQRFKDQENLLSTLIVIQNWSEEFTEPLSDIFPLIQKPISLEPVQSLLPYVDRKSGVFSLALDHIALINEDSEMLRARILLQNVKWRSRQNVTLIVSNELCPKLINNVRSHYTSDDIWRWKRLSREPLWAFSDLYFLFTDWPGVLGMMWNYFQDTEACVFKGALPVMTQTRVLHEQMAKVIEIQEIFRIHREAIDTLIDIKKLDAQDATVTKRLDQIKQQTSYNAATMDTIKEQLQNLIQLSFNMEAAAQGQSVARLSALAFLFVPLSYVASLFAVPGLSINPIWYPVSAIPLLIITTLVAIFSGKILGIISERLAVPRNNLPSFRTLFKRPKPTSGKDPEDGASTAPEEKQARHERLRTQQPRSYGTRRDFSPEDGLFNGRATYSERVIRKSESHEDKFVSDPERQSGGNEEEKKADELRNVLREYSYAEKEISTIIGKRPRKDMAKGKKVAVDSAPKTTWIKVHRKHLLPDTLISYGLPWDLDDYDTDYIIIKQWVSEDFQEELFAHTRRLREGNTATGTELKVISRSGLLRRKLKLFS